MKPHDDNFPRNPLKYLKTCIENNCHSINTPEMPAGKQAQPVLDDDQAKLVEAVREHWEGLQGNGENSRRVNTTAFFAT